MTANNKRTCSVNIFNSMLRLIAVFSCFGLTTVYGQRHSHYMGKAWSLGINTGISPFNIIKNETANKPLAFELRVERLINSFLSVSLNNQAYHLKLNDEFVNDGSASNYFVNVSGESKKVNNGNGTLDVNYRDYSVYLKKFKLMSSYIPIGFYYSVGLGVASVQTRIDKGYQYSYNQYYDNTFTLNYTSTKETKINALLPTIGFELGKTMRFLNDNMMLTVSLQTRKLFHKSEDEKSSLKNRFNEKSIEQVKQFNLIQLKLGLSYVL